ncbi:hypothetical protein RVR_5463 [Actinacidiphila reveromycinica]|uniref:Fis family transcriptional regulator n=1 Tax=Actinacidiphila reveromycinica TaxID=659352 RepID=A0A7U3UUI5_9ACTN|nr:hypothetical protein [Streptomyces sp. SN-593]BBA99014.1 hypothetical protein RVR_5463 [Streptomyces sp. SN-593]
MNDQPARSAPWSETDGVFLLRSVATAMVRLSDIASPGTFALPYPDEAQRALNNMVLNCLMLKARPPESLPHLVEWAAQRPLDRWPITLPPDAVPPGSLLLDKATRQPTQLCYEWAVDAEDSGARYSEQRYMAAASSRCREENYPEAYQAFRLLLVRRPVLTHRELTTIPAAADGDLGPLVDLMHDVYQPAPAGYLDRERRSYTACARCHTLLHLTTEDGLWCERQRCRNLDTVRRGREYQADDGGGVQLLIRPLRQWVSEPGAMETRLARQLTAIGADVELWPGFGAYGMRVRLPDDTVLAVDHKDWASPALLGRRATMPSPDPPYDRCVWVIPAARLRDQPAFRTTFERYRWSASPELMTDRELLRAARQLPETGRVGTRYADSGDEPTGGPF